eukprot:Nitzschia sp. Nitz4//scaffold173_size47512//5875//7002//NITZ4_007152-RA/size47512-processed-gene-0.32-mRNA-1//-1//CDS//3329538784//5095//frame0
MEESIADAVALASMTSGDKVAEAKGESNAPDTRYYACDQEKLEKLQSEKPWMKDPKYFKAVAVAPSAIMKMTMHCARGVDKGIAKCGNPIEVMGLLLGRPDPLHPTTLIVTDAFPLPIEGFETRVIADDEGVVNHMIALNESLEGFRNEKFMGWYHSHPFDLGDHSHCYLSQTDLSTQLQWQRAEDPHGNPFVAMVLDPLRSSHLGVPEIKAFRVYPPEYQSSIEFECPDGSVQRSEQSRLELWGSCWNRYYELSVEYYMSSTSRSVLNSLTQDYLWISNLKRGDPNGVVEKLEKTKDLTTLAPVPPSLSSGGTSAMLVDPEPVPLRSSGGGLDKSAGAKQGITPFAQDVSLVATEQLAEAASVLVQKQVFAPQN